MDGPTAGERIYAIGDIHGRSDLLEVMLGRIWADIAARPHCRPRIVFLGDYVDRGPASREVLDRLLELDAGEIATTFLLGNHDFYLLAYLDDPDWSARGLHWFHCGLGGAATLASYGIHDVSDRIPSVSHDAFLRVFPEAHRTFLRRARLMHRIGDYLFVHAGIRPGVPIEAQEPEDLTWIREPFLSSRADHGAKVVHGHTIVPFVEHHRNRIALDTGAVKTGVLSCVILEGTQVALLTGAGPRPLREGAGLGLNRMVRAGRTAIGRLIPRGMMALRSGSA